MKSDRAPYSPALSCGSADLRLVAAVVRSEESPDERDEDREERRVVEVFSIFWEALIAAARLLLVVLASLSFGATRGGSATTSASACASSGRLLDSSASWLRLRDHETDERAGYAGATGAQACFLNSHKVKKGRGSASGREQRTEARTTRVKREVGLRPRATAA
eukprot:scaffold193_cov255-Pinguiococcus_pyrenoidosus.AAC.38